MFFDELQLNDNILDALDAMNFSECTPIQELAIPPLLEGRDLVGIAQTGTGKTAAYLLPILNKLSEGGYPQDAVNCVIMSPTRELAQQIDQAMEGFSYFVPVSSVAVYGGNDGIHYAQECRGFELGADVVIATPGRLLSHIAVGNVDLSKVSFFVLDEADRMLSMGFIDDIMQIVAQLPKQRQTMLFSATMPQEIQQLANTILHNPVEVKVAVSKPADNIAQFAYVCHETQKIGLLQHLFAGGLEGRLWSRVVVFGGKKQRVKDIVRTLRRTLSALPDVPSSSNALNAADAPLSAEGEGASQARKARALRIGEIHSDLSQPERDAVMRDFRNGHVNILVATDIVSRGIDVDDIELVVNFDVPRDCEDYVHRIGRTARAGAAGTAVTLVNTDDQRSFARIESFIGHSVEKLPVPEALGEAPAYEPKTKSSSSHRRRGGRDGARKGRRRGSHEGVSSQKHAASSKEHAASSQKHAATSEGKLHKPAAEAPTQASGTSAQASGAKKRRRRGRKHGGA
ncbi:MAG: DEAD/DEAH box helicase [Bacteroidaceae bacterium]|nr:DEAD/DEAH box helicase [Bacteroidaceae bacterium]